MCIGIWGFGFAVEADAGMPLRYKWSNMIPTNLNSTRESRGAKTQESDQQRNPQDHSYR